MILKLKNKFHHRENLILLEDIEIKKIQVSSVVFSGKKNYKYFIRYKDDDHEPLCIVLPKTGAYVKRYDGETKWMNFFY